MGCGYHKPHLPMVFPQEFIDTLPRPNVEDYPLAADPFAPIGMPDAAWHPPNDPFPGMLESPRFNGTSNDTLARYYRRAYDAAISCAQPPIKPLLSAFVFRFVCTRSLNRSLARLQTRTGT